MGWTKHNFIIVNHYNFDELKKAREKGIELFNIDKYPRELNLVSEILQSVSNSYFSFFINCDGSKEGWETSDLYDQIREQFTLYLTEKSIHYVEIAMDTDNDKTYVTNTSSGSLVNIKPYHEHENY